MDDAPLAASLLASNRAMQHALLEQKRLVRSILRPDDASLDEHAVAADVRRTDVAAARGSASPARASFQKNDSNRCRAVYEKLLTSIIGSAELASFRRSKHISIGRCRHIAIVRGIRLPLCRQLIRDRFATTDETGWRVPDDCKRYESAILEEGFCYNNPCRTCVRIFSEHESALVCARQAAR